MNWLSNVFIVKQLDNFYEDTYLKYNIRFKVICNAHQHSKHNNTIWTLSQLNMIVLFLSVFIGTFPFSRITSRVHVDVLHPSQELRHVFMLTFYIPSQDLRHMFTLTCYIPSQELRHVFMLDEKRFEVLSVWHYPFIYSLAT
jgi:hypothetical protein